MSARILYRRAGAVVASIIGAAALLNSPAFSQTADTPTILFGHGVAQRYCGQCHGVGAELSRLDDAPHFNDLHKRYRGGGLDELLKEGMMTPDPSMEEGNMPGHPRMPQRRLDIDERIALAAYLRSLEPRAPQ